MFGSGISMSSAPGDPCEGPWLVARKNLIETSPLEEVALLRDFLACDLTDVGILELSRKYGFLGRYQCDVGVRRKWLSNSEGLNWPVEMITSFTWSGRGSIEKSGRSTRLAVNAEPVRCWRNELVRIKALESVSYALQKMPRSGSSMEIEQSPHAQVLNSFVGEAVDFAAKYSGWRKSSVYLPHELGMPEHLCKYDRPVSFERSSAVGWAIRSGPFRESTRRLQISDIGRWKRHDIVTLIAEYALIEQLNIALAEGSNYALLPEHPERLRLVPIDLLGWLYISLALSIRKGELPSYSVCKHCQKFFRYRSNKKYCSVRCLDNARYARNRARDKMKGQ